jgi:hypothetical protein
MQHPREVAKAGRLNASDSSVLCAGGGLVGWTAAAD